MKQTLLCTIIALATSTGCTNPAAPTTPIPPTRPATKPATEQAKKLQTTATVGGVRYTFKDAVVKTVPMDNGKSERVLFIKVNLENTGAADFAMKKGHGQLATDEGQKLASLSGEQVHAYLPEVWGPGAEIKLARGEKKDHIWIYSPAIIGQGKHLVFALDNGLRLEIDNKDVAQ